jgi:glycosyltransferase involved in cell wall biosynthesis
VSHLFIQIPCFNEESNLPTVLNTLPKIIPGFDKISVLVIDDGSTDKTSEVAATYGADYVVRFPSNRGLSAAFQAGIDFALSKGATHIVNTDADNQYPSEQIIDLVNRLVDNSADVVIGDRNPGAIKEFHPLKRIFQVLGSRLTTSLCGIKILDATSGFRAYTSEAASAIYITNPYTYTLESLIQLSFMRFRIEHVLVIKNPATRPSRLFKSTSQYMRKNGLVLLKSYIQFAPMKFFGALSTASAILGVICFSPFIGDYFHGRGQGHLQSLIVGTLFSLTSIQLLSIAFIGDSIRSSRLISQKLMQQSRLTQYHSRSI